MLKEKILNREKIIGTHINFSDPSVGRIAGLAGYDYIWIDMEHNYISFESLLAQVLAIRTTGTPVIVRAPQDDLTATDSLPPRCGSLEIQYRPHPSPESFW